MNKIESEVGKVEKEEDLIKILGMKDEEILEKVEKLKKLKRKIRKRRIIECKRYICNEIDLRKKKNKREE